MGKVNVKARIVARKVTFSFMYSHIFLFKSKKEQDLTSDFLQDLSKKQSWLCSDKAWIGSGSFVSNMIENSKQDQQKTQDLNFFFCYSQEDISKNYLEEVGEYILDNFFSYNQTPDFDMNYFLEVASRLFDYKQEVFAKINEFTSTFSIERMDVSDQCIFVIAYTEWKVLGTPKEVLINEMVELAKRYWDDWSPKLVNGILHKIIS